MLRHDNLASRNSTVELRDVQVPIATVLGLLWNCTGILPSTLHDGIAEAYEMHANEELPRMRNSFGAAARVLSRVIA